jgi:hypothetical protein
MILSFALSSIIDRLFLVKFRERQAGSLSPQTVDDLFGVKVVVENTQKLVFPKIYKKMPNRIRSILAKRLN